MSGQPRLDFVIAGMPRAGTTFLYHNLNRHPRIHLPWRKELNFLNLHRDRGEPWYARQLAGATDDQLVGDVEPGYVLVDDVPELLAATAPGVKIVIGVREPVSWARSLHAHFTRLGDPVPPLPEFVSRGWTRRQDGGELHYRLAGARPIALLESWRSVFGADLLLFDHDHFAADRLAVLTAIERFLGVDAYFEADNFDDRPHNASSQPLPPGLAWLARGQRVARVLETPGGRWLAGRVRPLVERWGEVAPVRRSAATEVVSGPVMAQLAPFAEHHRRLFSAGPIVLGDGSVPAWSGAQPAAATS